MNYDEDVLARAARVKLLLMDVDGVLTDGTYWHVPDGRGGLAETKAFDSQVQCVVAIISLAASGWHCRQARVTSCPVLKSPFTISA